MVYKKVLAFFLIMAMEGALFAPLFAQGGEAPDDVAAEEPVAEPVAPAAPVAPVAVPVVPAAAPSAVPRKAGLPRQDPNTSVNLSYGYMTQSLATGGGEFKSKLPKGTGDVRGMEVKYIGDARTYRFRYRLQTANYSGISNVEPHDLSVTNEHISLISWKPMAWMKGLSYGRGLYTSSRDAERTEPKVVVNKQWKVGLLAYGQYVMPVFSFLNMEARAEVGVPFVFREPYRRSGAFFYGMDLEGGLMLSHVVAKWQELAFGVMTRQEYVQFAGSGEQGSSNGSDVQNSFWFPLELRIRF